MYFNRNPLSKICLLQYLQKQAHKFLAKLKLRASYTITIIFNLGNNFRFNYYTSINTFYIFYNI